jgi:hypothetical protein
LARAQGEGTNAYGRLSGHSIIGERMRAALISMFHVARSRFFLFMIQDSDSGAEFIYRISDLPGEK